MSKFPKMAPRKPIARHHKSTILTNYLETVKTTHFANLICVFAKYVSLPNGASNVILLPSSHSLINHPGKASNVFWSFSLKLWNLLKNGVRQSPIESSMAHWCCRCNTGRNITVFVSYGPYKRPKVLSELSVRGAVFHTDGGFDNGNSLRNKEKAYARVSQCKVYASSPKQWFIITVTNSESVAAAWKFF